MDAKELWEQRNDQLGHLPGHVLLDLARNTGATREWRKAAVEIMIDKGYPQANHPDLEIFVREILAAKEAKAEVEAVVETAIEGPIPDATTKFETPEGFTIVPIPPTAGPLRASVTTHSLQSDDIVQNQD